MSIAEKKKRIEAQIGETKRRSTSELVLFGERGEEAFHKEGERFEVVAANGQRENGEVDGACAEAVVIPTVAPYFLPPLLASFSREFPQIELTIAEEITPILIANGERTTDGLLALDDIPLRGGEFVENGTSTRKEGFAEFG